MKICPACNATVVVIITIWGPAGATAITVPTCRIYLLTLADIRFLLDCGIALQVRNLENFFERLMKLIKAHPETDPRDACIAAMWLMFLLAPGRATAR